MTLSTITLKFRLLLFSLFVFYCCSFTVLAKSVHLGVVYPEIREPYRSVFESIISGINQQAKESNANEVQRLTLYKSTDKLILDNWINDNKIDSVIALGRRSHNLTISLMPKISVTTGAILMSKDLNKHNTGIVLNPNPELVFKQLRKLAPNVKRISVIYNPDKNAWLIEQATQVADKLNIQLDSYAVSNLHQSAQQYRDVLKLQSGTQNAVWLLNDNTVFDRNAIFPLVLQEAWNRQFLVFSNNPAHVKRGVLFAMFPNNVQMGKSLFKLVHENNSKSIKNNTMHALSDLLIAFNMRTAEHLRLNVTRQQRNKFNLVFPVQ